MTGKQTAEANVNVNAADDIVRAQKTTYKTHTQIHATQVPFLLLLLLLLLFVLLLLLLLLLPRLALSASWLTGCKKGSHRSRCIIIISHAGQLFEDLSNTVA